MLIAGDIVVNKACFPLLHGAYTLIWESDTRQLNKLMDVNSVVVRRALCHVIQAERVRRSGPEKETESAKVEEWERAQRIREREGVSACLGQSEFREEEGRKMESQTKPR